MNVNMLNVDMLSNHYQKGFTLIETLIAFSILCTIVSFFPLIITVFYDQKNDGLNKKETELFFIQAGKEIREARSLNSTWRKLEVINKTGEKVTYEKYGTLIRRQVNGTGHEIMLQNIKSFSFIVNGQHVELLIIGADGEQVSKNFTIRNKSIVQ